MSDDADVDVETSEWLSALDDVLRHEGRGRGVELLDALLERAKLEGLHPRGDLNTPYVNSIAAADEPAAGDDADVEARLRALVCWNAMAIVLQANRESSELGGHIASYQSAATLYEVGFNHFWRAPDEHCAGDLVYIQGHSAPGIYARALLEGRLEERRVRGFRQEIGGEGLSSYPHPWLMPDFWQFPTVSMGLGPLMAIHQARFMKYLEGRSLQEANDRKVWAFMGDGEMDEPESMGAISLAAREHLDNLIFVVNCNLQRLDGPVRGNGKIIQELETNFRGAGWNVIKVIWGSHWDPLLAADSEGALLRRMEEALDGDYQTYKSRDGAYVREHFFGSSPQLRALVADLSDEQVWALDRGGHDPRKVFAAFSAAVAHTGQPTVILAKTIKGYGMGAAGEGQNITHQQKKMPEEALLAFRDRFELPLTDEQARAGDLYIPASDSPELTYLREHREQLGGALPSRRRQAERLTAPALSSFQSQLDGTGEREVSTTMVLVRILASLIRDKQIGRRVVPIVPDESRTFGMEGMFRQLGIFSQVGQLYQPEDSEQLMSYREDRGGQILQEGINEPGAFSSWIAAATSYSNHAFPMVPFYIFYSMFGFQRIGDLAWAAGDSRARGFLIGGTSGRTTLNGEGLQHEDGHSHLMASAIPNCRAYDPAFGYELAVIVQDGLRRLLEEQEDAFYYLTVMNENYPQPPIPDGAEDGILRGMHRIRAGSGADSVRLLGSGAILREALAAAELLLADFAIDAEVWSVTSFSELARNGNGVDRANRLHPSREPQLSYVEECLGSGGPPVIAATDYVRSVAEQIRPWVGAPYTTLGTDGFGRSDYRRALRRFFEVDRHHVAVAALHALGRLEDAERAIDLYKIDQEAAAPWTL
ncbi:MAG TPA: pyruvate dehydrogenase (acetyl-transferring), homodimeric type [Solirubrobacteraceae bacterium]|jgi:pyruvate dehydrogenase E1 component|nr:pyruvate dehydrogenase (acetyl-transferring), homodimeric type [Solirubrobacteraceae bacterium]